MLAPIEILQPNSIRSADSMAVLVAAAVVTRMVVLAQVVLVFLDLAILVVSQRDQPLLVAVVVLGPLAAIAAAIMVALAARECPIRLLGHRLPAAVVAGVLVLLVVLERLLMAAVLVALVVEALLVPLILAVAAEVAMALVARVAAV